MSTGRTGPWNGTSPHTEHASPPHKIGVRLCISAKAPAAVCSSYCNPSKWLVACSLSLFILFLHVSYRQFINFSILSLPLTLCLYHLRSFPCSLPTPTLSTLQPSHLPQIEPFHSPIFQNASQHLQRFCRLTNIAYITPASSIPQSFAFIIRTYIPISYLHPNHAAQYLKLEFQSNGPFPSS